MLVHVQNSNAYTMFARTAEDKTKWIEAFKEALDNIQPRQRINSPHDVRGSLKSTLTIAIYMYRVNIIG